MGIRKSTGKNKKSKKRTEAVAVNADEIQRKARWIEAESPQGMRYRAVAARTGFAVLVLGMDGSAHSPSRGGLPDPDEAAPRRARDGRARCRAGTGAVHAVRPVRHAGADRGAGGRGEPESGRGARRHVEGAAATLARAGWRTRAVVRSGVAAAELLAAVRAERADVLVLGARGAGAVTHFLLGSVAEAALKHAPVEVLIVK